MNDEDMLEQLEEALDATVELEKSSRKRWRDLKKKHGETPEENEEERHQLWIEVKSARTVQRRCARNVNRLMAQIMKQFEAMPEFDQLIEDFKAINADLAAEAARIRDLQESIDNATEVLKGLESLIKRFVTLVGP